MMSHDQIAAYRGRAAAMLRAAGLVVTAAEEGAIEIADFGLGDFSREGLALLVYVNNERYCAKELVMWPRQRCPQHRHPPFGGGPGKMETFRCRCGRVRLWVGETAAGIRAGEMPVLHRADMGALRTPSGLAEPRPPPPPAAGEGGIGRYESLREVELGPGEQFTIPPDTWHWFEAGEEGAVVSEFSSASRDELDVFLDPGVRRMG